jgi:hypothetical protein
MGPVRAPFAFWAPLTKPVIGEEIGAKYPAAEPDVNCFTPAQSQQIKPTEPLRRVSALVACALLLYSSS